jgi:predicted MFS family arabinose efflux permease
VSVFQQPARQAMVMQVVDRPRLTNAIGLDSMVFNVSRSTGPALAGILIALVGAGGSYVAQAILYFLATLWTVQLRPLPPITASEPDDGLPVPHGRGGVHVGRSGHGGVGSHVGSHGGRHSLAGSTLDGWRYVARNETVRTGILITSLTALFAVPFTTLLPVFARDVLAVGPEGQGVLLSAMGIGALFSAVLIATLGARLPRGILMVSGAAAYGLCVMAFAASTWFPLSVVLMVLAGIANVACHALVRTVVQGYSPPEMGGRVMGLFQQTHVLQTTGGLAVGALATGWGAPWAVGAMAGICVLGAGVLALTTNVRAIR